MEITEIIKPWKLRNSYDAVFDGLPPNGDKPLFLQFWSAMCLWEKMETPGGLCARMPDFWVGHTQINHVNVQIPFLFLEESLLWNSQSTQTVRLTYTYTNTYMKFYMCIDCIIFVESVSFHNQRLLCNLPFTFLDPYMDEISTAIC